MKEMKIPLLLIAVIAPIVLSEKLEWKYDYCRIPSCLRNTHVFCQYKSPEVSRRCGEVAESRLTENEKALILKLHNHFRWVVYSGQETRGLRGSQPAAANFAYLEWDPVLEDMAHRWSIQCLPGEAECTDTADDYVTQLESRLVTRNSSEELSIEAILWNWYNEVADFDDYYIERHSEHKSFLMDTYHYTQIVWEKTKRIGCNVIRHSVSEYKIMRLVCNYGPGGNTQGRQVYEMKYV